MDKRVILMILDGLADKVGKGKTPLEVAKKPNLDWLASRSSCGLLWPIKGVAPESGEAQFVLLGYPLALYPGRGILEALGAGLKLKKDCVYFRVNFAQVRGSRIIDTRAKIPSSNRIEKINAIDKDIKLYPTVGYRGILEVRGISTNVSNTHPGYIRYKNYSRAISGKPFKKLCEGDKKSCKKLNSFITQVENILRDRTILLRGASNKLPRLKKMSNWAFIGDMPIEKGLAKIAGMKILKRRNEIMQILKSKESIYCQIKGPDKPGHLGDFFKKIKEIEKIDRKISPIIKAIKLNKLNAVLCITADHATPCSLKGHSSDPVPCLIWGKLKKDRVMKFNERECARGFKLEGKQLMKVLKNDNVSRNL